MGIQLIDQDLQKRTTLGNWSGQTVRSLTIQGRITSSVNFKESKSPPFIVINDESAPLLGSPPTL